MNVYRKIGILFFILSSILVILSGAFPVSYAMDSSAKIFLIFSGFLVGILNITSDEELGFLIASGVLLLTLGAGSLIIKTSVLGNIIMSFKYLALFIGSAAFVVALKIIVEYASMNYDLTPEERMKMATKELSMLEKTKALKIWDFIIFLAVSIVFILILLNLFFNTEKYESIILVVEIIISILFIIDLFVLYKKYVRFYTFLKRCWPDILAAIPAVHLIRLAKLFRIVKIMKLAATGSKTSKIMKIGHGMKFFSEDSGFNEYILNKKRIKRPSNSSRSGSAPAKAAKKRR